MLVIHYDSGARGDFLASILLSILPKINQDQRVIVQSLQYKKIHHGADYSFLNDSGIKIKIIHDYQLDNLMQISHLHHTKNADFLKTDQSDSLGEYEKIYLFIKYISEHECIAIKNKSKYNYIVKFQDLTDINYLKNLYRIINNAEMPLDIEMFATNNIQAQSHWADRTDNHQFKNLTKIIDFEIKNNILCTKKIPNALIDDLVNSNHVVMHIDQYYNELQ
jgi:hypothetical protein